MYDCVNRKFYTIQQLRNAGSIEIDTLAYLGLVLAIPSLWKNILKMDQMDRILDYSSKVVELQNKQWLSQYIYWNMLMKQYPMHQTSMLQLGLELSTKISEEVWGNLLPQFFQSVKPSKLRFFQYRVLTKSLTMNVHRAKWGREVSGYCTFCHQQAETILHLLWECQKIKPLCENWNKMMKH